MSDQITTEEKFSQAMQLLRSVPGALSRLLGEEIEFKHRAADDNEWEPIGIAGWNAYRFRPHADGESP